MESAGATHLCAIVEPKPKKRGEGTKMQGFAWSLCRKIKARRRGANEVRRKCACGHRGVMRERKFKKPRSPGGKRVIEERFRTNLRGNETEN